MAVPVRREPDRLQRGLLGAVPVVQSTALIRCQSRRSQGEVRVTPLLLCLL